MGIKILRHLCLALFLLLSGCGYHLASQAHTGGRSVSIPVFANNTLRPNLASCLTTRLVEQFSGSGGAVVVNPEQADLELTGTILTYSESASAFTANDKVAMYQVSMSAEASLRQAKTGAVLWKGIVRAVQDYQTNSNLALKSNAQESALRELCRKMAEDIERQSGNRF